MYYGYETLESIEARYGCVQEYLRVQQERDVYEAGDLFTCEGEIIGMMSTNLHGLDVVVEYDMNDLFMYTEDDGVEYEAVVTTDGRLIVWDEAIGSWIQIKRWA